VQKRKSNQGTTATEEPLHNIREILAAYGDDYRNSNYDNANLPNESNHSRGRWPADLTNDPAEKYALVTPR